MKHDIEIVAADVIVAGTGSAGFCAADRLSMLGVKNLLMITDKIHAGTSRNAGSDKQTYYKLTLAGGEPDSVRDMAETLFSGGAMDGDVALAEAAWSTRAFYHLVEAGVGFPHNRYGEYVGYKTDHDPRQRATSAGPYTSKSMVEHLEARVRAAGVTIMEGCRIVDLIVDDGRIRGLLCWAIEEARFQLFQCDYLVYATGGPAGIYADSVYPHGQWGAQGAALRAGARGKNLTEWQFGMASLTPRWNVSGSYMQVIPRFISTEPDGSDEREFLLEAVGAGDLGSLIFLKGYQWPFDVRKARGGSSLIDLLVYRETVMRSRRVFLDFTRNFTGYDPTCLSEEASRYLAQTGAAGLNTPVGRLRAMNDPAYWFYREKGVDLEKTLLQIAVCAQHNNGGLEVDSWWQSTIAGLFPVGEAAGAHGVYRPGGAALNSGQVGATRAAVCIARDLDQRRRRDDAVPHRPSRTDFTGTREHMIGSDSGEPVSFTDLAEPVVDRADSFLQKAIRTPIAVPQAGSGCETAHDGTGEDSDQVAVGDRLARAMRLMSDNAGLVRTPEGIRTARADAEAQWESLESRSVPADSGSRKSLDRLFLLRDVLSAQVVYLAAMEDYIRHGGHSRGSVLYTDPDGDLPNLPGRPPLGLPESFRFILDNGELDDVVQEVHWDGRTTPTFDWRSRRPLPDDDQVFESVWKNYRDWSS